MLKSFFRMSAVVLVTAIVGCDSTDNPTPQADQSAPDAGLNALEQMKQGGTTPQKTADMAKEAKAKKK